MFRNHKLNFIILFLISIIFGWQLFRQGFFNTQDDLQTMRLYEMNRCFQDGQIPCRWSPDMGAGYGQPTFNYYSVFPYTLGELVHLSGVSYVDTVKILFLLCLIFSIIFAYLLLSEIVSLPAAFIGAVTYLIVPYRALEIFVRGALAETMALSLIPLVLFFLVRAIKKDTVTNYIGLSFSLGILLITHNITSILFAPVFVIFLVYFLLTNKTSKNHAISLFVSIVLGIGLSAFFTIPVALERGLIQSTFLTQGYFDFRAHFVTLKQLFLSNIWGYGPSIPGPEDTLSFSIGIFQTFIFFISLLIFVIFRQKNKNIITTGIIFWLITFFYIFLTHNQSTPIWEKFSFMSYIQFPWRLLGIVALGTSLLIGIVVELLPKKSLNYVIIPSLIIISFLNFNFYRFEKYLPSVTDNTVLTGEQFIVQQKSTLQDYLPVSSLITPKEIAPNLPQTSSSRVNINYFNKRSNYFASEFDVYEDNVVVTFPIVYYPGWQVFHNRLGSYYQFSYDNDLGLITVKLNKGHHVIQGFFENTPPRMVGNLLTFLSAAILVLWYVIDKHETE